MTTSRETVPNKALSGTELRTLILADFTRLLDNEGLLSQYIAYGRVAYDVTLRLHLDNPLSPESTSRVASRLQAKGAVEASPGRAAVEPPPLTAPSADATVSASSVARNITSPNAERLRTGLPIPVETKQADGTRITEMVKYPPDPALGEGDSRGYDVTAAARTDWGLLDAPQPVATSVATSADVRNEQDAPVFTGDLARLCHCGYPRGLHALSGLSTQPPLNGHVCTGFADASIPLPVEVKQAWPVPVGS